MSKFITKDIVKLTKVTESIKSGEYDKRIDLNRNDEIGLIANHIDDMANEIESNIHKLEEQTISKQRFIDNFTHELKTPLTSIIGYADLLRKNKYDKELFDKGLYHIYEEGKRLSFISKSMTEIILLKNREMNLSQENILDLLNEVKEVNELRQYGKNLLIDVKSDSIAINVDKYLLKTVLINLLDNAIKASEDKQSITIGAYKDNEVINIYVEDYGKGISSEDLGNILEPFYLVDKSRCKKEESLGLGLSICSEILELMNAKLHIASEVNQGTKVNIQFDFTTS